MTHAGRLSVLIICGVAVTVGLSYLSRPPVAPPAPDTIYVKVSAKSAAVAETTTRTVTRIRTRVDSFFQMDTFWRHDTVIRRSLDTVFKQCEACAEQLRVHRRTSDSTIRARDDTIAHLRARLASCQRQKPWYALGGATVSLLACR